MWGATTNPDSRYVINVFQSTLPVWGATHCGGGGVSGGGISIHAPRVGSDPISLMISVSAFRFQSTLPVWGATSPCVITSFGQIFQSTLPVWGATHILPHDPQGRCISIHAPRVGSDHALPAIQDVQALFQSTLPVWGATHLTGTIPISILFQSTLPVWGATGAQVPGDPGRAISIHAPRVGSDHTAGRMPVMSRTFQSTLPVWGATLFSAGIDRRPHISIHAPRVGSDGHGLTSCSAVRNFNPRSPCGERPMVFPAPNA